MVSRLGTALLRSRGLHHRAIFYSAALSAATSSRCAFPPCLLAFACNQTPSQTTQQQWRKPGAIYQAFLPREEVDMFRIGPSFLRLMLPAIAAVARVETDSSDLPFESLCWFVQLTNRLDFRFVLSVARSGQCSTRRLLP